MRCRTMKLWALATLALSMIAFDDRSSVRAEFYVGEYKTVAAPSRGGGRDAVDADNEIVQSRQLKVDNHQHTKLVLLSLY